MTPNNGGGEHSTPEEQHAYRRGWLEASRFICGALTGIVAIKTAVDVATGNLNELQYDLVYGTVTGGATFVLHEALKNHNSAPDTGQQRSDTVE